MRLRLSSWCFKAGLVVVLLTITSPVTAQEPTDDQPLGIEIVNGVHLFAGLNCNIIAVTGPDGVLIIDSGLTSEFERLQKAITGLDAGRVQIVINTHFHFDHVEGNEVLAKKGAVVVAHKNGRLRMQEEWRFPEDLGLGMPLVSPYPEGALPKVTITDELAMHFGGQQIKILHIPSAHTDADLVVFLKNANILHTGDLYLSNGFPPGGDTFHGGSIDGLIAAVDTLVDLINDDTQVVPGHGPISNRQELREYQQMLVAGRNSIATLIAEGMNLEEILTANPTTGLYTRGESWLPEEMFIRLVYADLAWSNTPATTKGSDLIYPAEELE